MRIRSLFCCEVRLGVSVGPSDAFGVCAPSIDGGSLLAGGAAGCRARRALGPLVTDEGMGGADDGLQYAEGPIDSKVTCVKRFTLLCDIGANGQRMVAFSLRRDCWSVPCSRVRHAHCRVSSSQA